MQAYRDVDVRGIDPGGEIVGPDGRAGDGLIVRGQSQRGVAAARFGLVLAGANHADDRLGHLVVAQSRHPNRVAGRAWGDSVAARSVHKGRRRALDLCDVKNRQPEHQPREAVRRVGPTRHRLALFCFVRRAVPHFGEPRIDKVFHATRRWSAGCQFRGHVFEQVTIQLTGP